MRVDKGWIGLFCDFSPSLASKGASGEAPSPRHNLCGTRGRMAYRVEKVGVVGAGLMGHGIAQVFASQGYPVVMVDVAQEQLQKALDRIRENLDFLAERGLLEGDKNEVLKRIQTSTALEELAGCDFVVECVFEDLGLKQEVFYRLDQICPPSAILASNTSVISITEIAQKAQRRERILGTHFWNPPYLIPLVEVVKGRDTSEEVFEFTYQFLLRVGKKAIKCLKDVPGFVANRLQHALWREAVYLVQEGIADPETVDEAVKYSFGLRLPVLGPLENADMVGLDLILSIHDYIFPHLCASKEASPVLRKKVQEGELGFKTSKGFYRWDDEAKEGKRRELIDHLIKWHKDRREGRDG